MAKTKSQGKEAFINKAHNIHGDKYNYSKVEYLNNKIKVCIICPIHGEFWQKPGDHLNRHNCPKCQESFFESKVRNILERNNIIYEKEKKFEWLKNKGKLRLDFYLPKYNVALECQGMQHYKPVNFGSEDNITALTRFHYTLDNDKKKKDLCDEHNIKIL